MHDLKGFSLNARPPLPHHRPRPTRFPWVAAGSQERPLTPRLRLAPGRRGIAFDIEAATDRDDWGALLHPGRLPARGDRGEPLYSTLHLLRQRRAMLDELCQICGGPAGADERGVLWLLDDTVAGQAPGWPEDAITMHPPVCARCAPAAVAECHALLDGYTAVRVRDPQLYGYYGDLYRPGAGPAGPVPEIAQRKVVLSFTDPRLPWLLCAQSAVRLTGCTVVDLDEELAAAEAGR